MKRTAFLLSLVLLSAFFICACAVAEAPVAAPVEPQTAVPEKERLYMDSENGYDLSGRKFTAEGLTTLCAALGMKTWEDLATLILAFDLHTTADVRRCDLEQYGGFSVDAVPVREEGAAYISLRGKALCALIFTEQEGIFTPACLVLSPRTYTPLSARPAFVRGADGSLFFLYDYESGSGSNYEAWNSCDTGELLLTFLKSCESRENSWRTDGGDWKVSETATLSRESALTEDGFLLAAKNELEIRAWERGAREREASTGSASLAYNVYYDARARRFFTTVNARMALYGELAEGEDKLVAECAAWQRIWIAPALCYVVPPEESDRFFLSELGAPDAPYSGGRFGGWPLTQEKLDLLKLYIDARAGEGLKDALLLGGIGLELPEGFPSLLWSEIQTADCRFDFYTASEREVYMQIHILRGEEAGCEGDRCVLLVFELTGADTWAATRFLTWDASHAGYLGDGAVVQYDHAARTRVVSILAGEKDVQFVWLNTGAIETEFAYLSYDPADKTGISYDFADSVENGVSHLSYDPADGTVSSYIVREDGLKTGGSFYVFDLSEDGDDSYVFPLFLTEDGAPFVSEKYDLREFMRGREETAP